MKVEKLEKVLWQKIRRRRRNTYQLVDWCQILVFSILATEKKSVKKMLK